MSSSRSSCVPKADLRALNGRYCVHFPTWRTRGLFLTRSNQPLGCFIPTCHDASESYGRNLEDPKPVHQTSCFFCKHQGPVNRARSSRIGVDSPTLAESRLEQCCYQITELSLADQAIKKSISQVKTAQLSVTYQIGDAPFRDTPWICLWAHWEVL